MQIIMSTKIAELATITMYQEESGDYLIEGVCMESGETLALDHASCDLKKAFECYQAACATVFAGLSLGA